MTRVRAAQRRGRRACARRTVVRDEADATERRVAPACLQRAQLGRLVVAVDAAAVLAHVADANRQAAAHGHQRGDEQRPLVRPRAGHGLEAAAGEAARGLLGAAEAAHGGVFAAGESER